MKSDPVKRSNARQLLIDCLRRNLLLLDSQFAPRISAVFYRGAGVQTIRVRQTPAGRPKGGPCTHRPIKRQSCHDLPLDICRKFRFWSPLRMRARPRVNLLRQLSRKLITLYKTSYIFKPDDRQDNNLSIIAQKKAVSKKMFEGACFETRHYEILQLF